jgi:hypothetical protein
MEYHSMYNQYLNSITQSDKEMKYKHTKQVDQYINVLGVGKVRRTVDSNTQQVSVQLTEVLETIMKTRVGDLNVFLPGTKRDFRISVSLEAKCILLLIRQPELQE